MVQKPESPESLPVRATISEALTDLIDVLLPGDEAFPAGSTLGTQRLVADRMRARHGGRSLQALIETIDICGGPLARLDAGAREDLVRRLEREHPTVFAEVRDIAYLSYYESAEVVDAIRGLGHCYNATPQPEGYPLAAFDPTVDTPTHGRGFYKATGDVERLDLPAIGENKND